MAVTYTKFGHEWFRGIMAAYHVAKWEVVKDAASWKAQLRWIDDSGETQRIDLPDDARFNENFWTLLHMRLRLTQGEMVPQ